jgi:hypothetical protein
VCRRRDQFAGRCLAGEEPIAVQFVSEFIHHFALLAKPFDTGEDQRSTMDLPH